MRERMIRAMAQLEGHRASIKEAHGKLHGRAHEQLDSMGPMVQTVHEHIEADRAGGVMGHRRLSTALNERERLERFVAR